jgi:glycosyltransferase A (GT-A) superfamily protein (DUF2064 family)
VALLVGDAPEISSRTLEAAFARLERARGRAAVLGPSPDGGSVLIALSAPASTPFQAVPWSTPRARVALSAALADDAFSVDELEPVADIDGFRDVERLAARLRGRDDLLELRRAALAVIAEHARRDGDPPARGTLARLMMAAFKPRGPLVPV